LTPQTLKRRKVSGNSSKSFVSTSTLSTSDRDEVSVDESCHNRRKQKSTTKKSDSPQLDPKTAEIVRELLVQIRREHESVSDFNVVVERLVTKYRDQQ
jgi:hypothetical protein